MPWDYRVNGLYGSRESGFTYRQSNDALDTSSGTRETNSISIDSFGLADGLSFRISYFDAYNGDGVSLRLKMTASADRIDTALIQLMYHLKVSTSMLLQCRCGLRVLCIGSRHASFSTGRCVLRIGRIRSGSSCRDFRCREVRWHDAGPDPGRSALIIHGSRKPSAAGLLRWCFLVNFARRVAEAGGHWQHQRHVGGAKAVLLRCDINFPAEPSAILGLVDLNRRTCPAKGGQPNTGFNPTNRLSVPMKRTDLT